MMWQVKRLATIGVLLSIMLVLGTAFAQPTGPQFSADYNRFSFSSDSTFFEFYVSLQRSSLTYLPVDSVFRAQFTVKAEIMAEDSLVDTKIWTSFNDVDKLESITVGQSMALINSFLLPDGIFKVRLTVIDDNSKQENTIEFAAQLLAFDGDSLLVSDIELASNITRDSLTTPYTKNGYSILPHPTALYGIGLPVLYAYSEIYHLKADPSQSPSSYSVQYQIYDADGKLQKEWAPRVRPKPGKSAVEVNALNVVTLLSGAYSLVMNVEDQLSGEKAQSTRRFYVYREEDYAEGGARFEKKEEVSGAGSPGVDAGRYDTMSKDELDTEFDFSRYITSKEERQTWKRIKNVEGKREFLKKFWADRDQTPGTPINEYKIEYMRRLQTANEEFKGTFKNGWQTDRGRVIMVYGFPDERERFPFSTDTRAYEVWHYYSVQGGVNFIFVDRRGMGDLELVHSTARGEIYDSEWSRFLTASGGASSVGTMYD